MGHTPCALHRLIRKSMRAKRDHCCQCRSPLNNTCGQTADYEIADRKIIPVNGLGGVPTAMVPYHRAPLSSVSGSLVVLRLRDSSMPPERGWVMPVFC